MPQRTRGRTTAAANPNPPASAMQPAPPAEGARRAKRAGKQTNEHPLAPEAIARTLRAVADELERDPALARRVAGSAGYAAMDFASQAETPAEPEAAIGRARGRAFRPRLVTGPDATLAPGIPDPFALRAERGEAGLRAVLEELRLGTLRAIIREHWLDPAGRLVRQNDATRLRMAIVEATARGRAGT